MTSEWSVLEAGAGGAEIVSQRCNVRPIGTDAAGVNGKAEALRLIDAQTGVVEFSEAVAFGGREAVGPGTVHRTERAAHVPSLSHDIEEIVPISTVPHRGLSS
jgi:hypothetical protein